MNFFRSFFIAMTIGLTTLLSGCVIETVNDGNFAIGAGSYSGKYQEEIYTPDWYWAPLTNLTQISGQENVVQILNVTPKDKNNVLLQDLDIVFTYRAIPKNSLKFLRERGGLTPLPSNREVFMLGYDKLQKDGKSMVQTSTQKYTSEEMLANIKQLETTFKNDLQNEIDGLYGAETFEILDVKISNIKVAPYIEDKVAQVEILKAEQQKNIERMKVIQSTAQVKNAEAAMLKEAIQQSGLTVEQYLRHEMIKAIANNEGTSSNTPVNVVVTTSLDDKSSK